MTWLQFIANMSGALAWPIAVVAIVCILRRELVALLKRIAEISLPGGYKVIFAKAVEESRVALEKIEITAQPKFRGRHFTTDSVIQYLLGKSPSNLTLMSQMLNAYSYLLELLLEIRDIIEKPQLDDPEEVVRELARQNLVGQSFVTAFENIRNARNALVHLDEKDVGTFEAIQFASNIMRLTEYLEALKEQKTHRRDQS